MYLNGSKIESVAGTSLQHRKIRIKDCRGTSRLLDNALKDQPKDAPGIVFMYFGCGSIDSTASASDIVGQRRCSSHIT